MKIKIWVMFFTALFFLAGCKGQTSFYKGPQEKTPGDVAPSELTQATPIEPKPGDTSTTAQLEAAVWFKPYLYKPEFEITRKAEVQRVFTPWEGVKDFGTTFRNEAFGIAVAPNGNVNVVGKTYESEDDKYFNALWLTFTRFGAMYEPLIIDLEVDSSVARGIAVDNNSNVYIAVNTYEDVPVSPDAYDTIYETIYLLKYDSSKNKIWSQPLGVLTKRDQVYAVSVDKIHNLIYVVGDTMGDIDQDEHRFGDGDAFIAQYSADRNLNWVRQFGTSKWDSALGVAVDKEGYVYVGGYTTGALEECEPIGGEDAFIVKYNQAGDPVYYHQFGTEEDERIHALDVDEAGNVYAAGYTKGKLMTLPVPPDWSERAYDFFVVKLKPEGDNLTMVWGNQFGTKYNDRAYDVKLDGKGNVYAVGIENEAVAYGKRGQFVVYKLSTINGQKGWSDHAERDGSVAMGIDFDKDGNFYITGSFYGDLFGVNSEGESDIFVIKYDANNRRQ